MIVDETPSRTRFTFKLVASMRALHEDPGQRVEDESTNTHNVSRFVFKVNSMLLVTKVSLNKDQEKFQDLEAQTLKAEIDKVKTIGAKRIRDTTRLAKELEEN